MVRIDDYNVGSNVEEYSGYIMVQVKYEENNISFRIIPNQFSKLIF